MAATTTLETIKPDWDLIQAAYLQGFSPKELSDKFNVEVRTIHKRVVRGNWAKLKTASRQMVMTEPGKGVLTDHSALVRQRLSDELIRASAKLDTLPEPKSVQSRSERGKMLKDLVEPAKVLYGWDQSTTTNVFNLALLESAEFIPAKQVQVVDVEQVKLVNDTQIDDN